MVEHALEMVDGNGLEGTAVDGLGIVPPNLEGDGANHGCELLCVNNGRKGVLGVLCYVKPSDLRSVVENCGSFRKQGTVHVLSR